MVLMGAEGREYAQSTPLCWETLLWWDRTHGQLRWDTWTFLAGLSHPHLPCSALSPSGWWGTECPDCSFSSTIYTTWMKSPTQRVFPSTPANISPPLPVSDCILCSSKGSAPTHHSIISPRSRLPPCCLGRAQESTVRKYLSSISTACLTEAHTGSLSNVTCPPHSHHTFLCERAQPGSSKIFQRWQGRTFWGPCCVRLYELLGSRQSEEKLSVGSLWLHRLLKHWAYLTSWGWMW